MIDTTDNQILILSDDSTLDLGKTTQITILLNTAPDGLSGYNLTVRLTNPEVAAIVGVQFPSWAMLPTNSTTPGDSIWCKAADLTGASGTANITLVTVTVRGDSAGATNITVLPDRVEDRQGGRYIPGIQEARLTVGTAPIPPVANFTATPTSGKVPLTVNFNDTSTGTPSSWKWDFGDGGTSTEQDPLHTYTTIGTYSVTLRASNEHGNTTEYKKDHISVHLRADFNRNGRIDIGDVAKVAWMAAQLIPEDLEADFNKIEGVDAGDAARIAYYYVGKIPAL